MQGSKREEMRADASEPAPRPAALVPPLMYRVMQAEGEYPMTGDSATTLGARVPKDIPADGQIVRPRTGGMSVRPRISDIPAMFLPRRLKHLNRAATGNNSLIVWRSGEGPFASLPVTKDLTLRPDAPDHGVVEPAVETAFDSYQNALWATRESWVNGET